MKTDDYINKLIWLMSESKEAEEAPTMQQNMCNKIGSSGNGVKESYLAEDYCLRNDCTNCPFQSSKAEKTVIKVLNENR